MNIPNKKEFSLNYKNKELKFTVSDIAERANASVIGEYGDTAMIATVVMSDKDKDTDFFPLTVNYEERFYAAGKILGSRFIRREGKSPDFAILSGRLIDRTIRPLFNQKIRRDLQVVITVLSYDEENEPEFLALMTASLALSISDIPWNGPVAGVRIFGDNKGLNVNPVNSQIADSLDESGVFDAFFAGTKDKINMIEIAGNEAHSDAIEKSFVVAQNEIKELISFQEKIINEIGKEKQNVQGVEIEERLIKEVYAFKDKFDTAMFSSKNETEQGVDDVKKELFKYLDGLDLSTKNIDIVIDEVLNEIAHDHGIKNDERVDGRKMDEIRPLHADVGLFKRLHGSAYFSRGKTQSFSVTTLASISSEQVTEGMEGLAKSRFMFHYNFPPYSTGEVGRIGFPSRREIGHGALARKALAPMIPSKDDFPYAIRVVSEIFSSNGSSSMASVCAGSLSLMDAGVPIKKPVAGIAMGLLVSQDLDRKNEFKVLTDIQGPEDHYGDMDLKIAGTRDGINAIQMDVKVDGINEEIFKIAVDKAEKARMEILDKIESVIAKPRAKLSQFAPIIVKISVDKEKIGAVIGSGGKMINSIIEQFGLESIDIEDDGRVFVSADSVEKADKASEYILNLTKEFEIGDVVEGKIIKIMDFGAIVDLGGSKDGMVHVSEINNDFVKDINTVLKVGDVVHAKVIKNDNGKIALSIKALNKDK